MSAIALVIQCVCVCSAHSMFKLLCTHTFDVHYERNTFIERYFRNRVNCCKYLLLLFGILNNTVNLFPLLCKYPEKERVRRKEREKIRSAKERSNAMLKERERSA